MSRMHVAVAVLALLVTSTAHADTSSAPQRIELPAAASRNYAQNYKDSALAFCIAKAYSSESGAHADAAATADGLDQWSRYDIENSSGEIPKLVERFLKHEYHSIQGPGVKLDLLKCVDMYHSKELAALVKRYVPKPTRSYRQDNSPGVP